MSQLKLSVFRLTIPADTYSGPVAVRVYSLPAREDGVVFTAPRFSAVLAGGQNAIEQGQIWPSMCEMSSTDPGNVNLLLNMSAESVILSAAAYVDILMLDKGLDVIETLTPVT